MMKTAWTIAGSDSGGGAGIQTDLKTFQSFGIHGATVITAITAQNTLGVFDISLTTKELLLNQIKALLNDLPAQAIKLGMLGSKEIATAISKFLSDYSGTVICDPVMVATSGDRLSVEDTTQVYLDHIFPNSTLITPNLSEASIFTGHSCDTRDSLTHAAKIILEKTRGSVLVKGYNDPHADTVSDLLLTHDRSYWITGYRVKNVQAHGTGCTLSSAITSMSALGFDVIDSVIAAKAYVSRGMRKSFQPSTGASILYHGDWGTSLFNDLDFPWIEPIVSTHFPTMVQNELLFYPIVDRAHWVEKLKNTKVPAIQIRIKDLKGYELEKEIRFAIETAKQNDIRIFVNDYWELAAKYGAFGVHLGQEDLDNTPIKEVEKAKLRLGISTHSISELARAKGIKPSYIAIGAIFPTVKPMKSKPQGIATLRQWSQFISCPVVAIGGLTLDKIPDLKGAGVHCFSCVRDIVESHDPVAKVKEWLNQVM